MTRASELGLASGDVEALLRRLVVAQGVDSFIIFDVSGCESRVELQERSGEIGPFREGFIC